MRNARSQFLAVLAIGLLFPILLHADTIVRWTLQGVHLDNIENSPITQGGAISGYFDFYCYSAPLPGVCNNSQLVNWDVTVQGATYAPPTFELNCCWMSTIAGANFLPSNSWGHYMQFPGTNTVGFQQPPQGQPYAVGDAGLTLSFDPNHWLGELLGGTVQLAP